MQAEALSWPVAGIRVPVQHATAYQSNQQTWTAPGFLLLGLLITACNAGSDFAVVRKAGELGRSTRSEVLIRIRRSGPNSLCSTFRRRSRQSFPGG